MKFLCLDLGVKHTGLATAGSTQIVEPIGTIHHRTTNELLDQLKKLIQENRPNIIVIGQPEKGIMRKIAMKVKEEIGGKFETRIYFQDENLSSLEARRKMIETGKSPAKRKEKEHTAAAAIILQNFLEENPKL